jgi:hypothetical protein
VISWDEFAEHCLTHDELSNLEQDDLEHSRLPNIQNRDIIHRLTFVKGE